MTTPKEQYVYLIFFYHGQKDDRQIEKQEAFFHDGSEITSLQHILELEKTLAENNYVFPQVINYVFLRKQKQQI